MILISGFEDVLCATEKTASECRRCEKGFFKADKSNTSWGMKCKRELFEQCIDLCWEMTVKNSVKNSVLDGVKVSHLCLFHSDITILVTF